MTFWTAVFVALWAGFAIGLVVGLRLASWADQRGQHQAGWTLTTLDPTTKREMFCPRCGRLDGTHSNTCERSRIDQLVAPARRRDESPARGRGYAGGDGQDLPQSNNVVPRGAHFGTKDRR